MSGRARPGPGEARHLQASAWEAEPRDDAAEATRWHGKHRDSGMLHVDDRDFAALLEAAKDA